MAKPIFVIMTSKNLTEVIRKALEDKLFDYHVLFASDVSTLKDGEIKFECFNPARIKPKELFKIKEILKEENVI